MKTSVIVSILLLCGTTVAQTTPAQTEHREGIAMAHLQAGSDACAKIAAAIASLPPHGGTVDARSLHGAQTCNSDPFASVASGLNKPVVLMLGAGTMTSTATWNPNSGSAIEGICGTNPEGLSTPMSGTIIKWAGAPSTPMIHYYGTSGTRFRCVTLSGNNVPGSIGILTDSSGVGSNHGSHSLFEHFAIRATQQAMVCGNPSNTPDTANAAYDLQEIRNFFIGGTSAPNSEGIHINSDNCFDGGLIENGSFIGVNKAIAIINGGGPYFVLDRLASGNLEGPDATFIYLGPGTKFAPDIFRSHNEGSSTVYSIHDSSCTERSPIWHGNAIQDDVLVDGCSKVISIGNSGHGPNRKTGGTWSVAGRATVFSLWDTLNRDPNHSPWSNSWTIDTAANSGATRSGNVATIRTTTAHALAVGTSVTIADVSDASFNGHVTITAVPNPTSFSYSNSGPSVRASEAGGGAVKGGGLQSVSQDGHWRIPRLIFDGFPSQQIATSANLFDIDAAGPVRMCRNTNGNCGLQVYRSGTASKAFEVAATGGTVFYDNSGSVVGSVNPAGKATFNGGLQVGGSVAQSSGLKHQRVSTGMVAAGSSAEVVLRWAAPFPDANYSPVCSLQEPTQSIATIRLHHLEAVMPTGVVVRIVNEDRASPHAGILVCQAMHD